ncbi:MAG TPA: hypothetical protein VFF12_05680 [Myxococcaceae bacterium]|nr:hypothetical protein [Myxococcaceae bacterium]
MRRHLFLVPALSFALAACGVGTDAPTTFSVPNGGPPDPVTAPVADAGSPSTGTVDSGTVSQPETAAPGNGIFPPDNAWNTRIDDAPVDPHSDAYIASIGASGKLVASWDEAGNGLPYVEVSPDQQKVPVSFWGFPKESDPGPYPIPWNAPVQIGSDGHVLVVDRGNGWLYELLQASRNSDGSWQASNGAKWNLRSNDGRPLRWTSADAAGMAVFPGLVRWDEVNSGWISHALRFAVNRSQRGFVSPATHAAGSCALGSDCPPMGLRLRLKKSVDISGFSWRMQVILLALKQYGMFVADNTGTSDGLWLAGAPHSGWSDEENLTLGSIHGSDFEVVAHGDIEPQ